jgi:hypothetical protein
MDHAAMKGYTPSASSYMMRELQSLSLHSFGLLKAAISTLCAGCANRTVFWDTDMVCSSAAMGGSVDVMVYLQQQGIQFTADVLKDMLDHAGVHNKLAATQWLRQQGAEWPAVLRAWPGEVLAWARAEGCTSPRE